MQCIIVCGIILGFVQCQDITFIDDDVIVNDLLLEDRRNRTFNKVCTTPNGEEATCKSLYDCAAILAALLNEEPLSENFARASQCEIAPFVCCGSAGNFVQKRGNPPEQLTTTTETSTKPTVPATPTTTATTVRSFIKPKFTEVSIPENQTKQEAVDFAIQSLLPDRRFCGFQHTDDYIYNKTETAFDEFPWLVYIPIKEITENSFFKRFNVYIESMRCTGFIISKRYVLTSRWCGQKDEIMDTVFVGQYDRNKVTICNDDPDFPECTEPVIELKVTEVLIPQVKTMYNSGFKLLRLEKPLFFTDYVRPICLPLSDSDRPDINDTIVTSGWGAERYYESQGKIKKRIKHTVQEIEFGGDDAWRVCYAPQNKNETICEGDHGSPAMYVKGRNQWFAAGVLSEESLFCEGFEEDVIPCADLLADVNIEWILLNMRP